MSTIINIPNKSGGDEQLYGVKTLKTGVTNNVLPSELYKSIYSLDEGKLYAAISSWSSWQNMFKDCVKLETLDLSNWDPSHVQNFYGMFQGCQGLTSLNLTGWNPSSATSMQSMFTSCNKIKNLDVAGWNVSRVTNMREMFMSMQQLQKLDLTGWNTAACTNFLNMFLGNYSLAKIWVPSTFTSNNASIYTPFRAGTNGTTHVYTDATDATTQGWGTIDNSFTMHYNSTYQDFLNA